MNFRIIWYSSLNYLFSTVPNQLRKKSTNSALDEDIWNTTKEKVAHELPIKISTQFPVTQGVTWKETADKWREITQSRTGN